jgi:hypothetical protein
VTSSTFKSALFAQQTDEAILVLLEINHEDLSAPIRVVNNPEDIVLGGEVYDDDGLVTDGIGTVTDGTGVTYSAFGFEVNLPDNDGRTEITICNVDRQIVETIRSVDTPPSVRMSVVLADTPDVVEAGPYDFELSDVTYNALIVRGTLAFDYLQDEPYPGDRFTPAQYPGL